MTTYYRFFHFFAAILLSCLALSASAKPSLLEAANAFIGENITAPGASWVIADERGILSGTTGEEIKPSSAFIWGSVSKPIAGLVAARQVCVGTLDLDQRLVDIVPAFQPEDERARQITIRHLLSHTSGIPPLLDLLDDPTQGRDLRRVISNIANKNLLFTPGSSYGYSSTNFLLVQAVLEAVTGQPYRDLLEQELAARGAKAITARADADAFSGGHQYFLGQTYGVETTYDELGLAYGYLGGTAENLAAIGRSVLAELANEASSCNPAKLATTTTVDINNGNTYGLGWRNSTWHDQSVLWHAGAANGYAAFFAILPETKAVIVVLQNAFGPLHDERLIAPALGATNILIGNSLSPASFPIVYWGALALIGVVLVLLLVCLRRSKTNKGALLSGAFGLLSFIGAALMPQLTSAGSWRVAMLWAPDIATGIILIGILGLVLLIKSLTTGKYKSS